MNKRIFSEKQRKVWLMIGRKAICTEIVAFEGKSLIQGSENLFRVKKSELEKEKGGNREEKRRKR